MFRIRRWLSVLLVLFVACLEGLPTHGKDDKVSATPVRSDVSVNSSESEGRHRGGDGRRRDHLDGRGEQGPVVGAGAVGTFGGAGSTDGRPMGGTVGTFGSTGPIVATGPVGGMGGGKLAFELAEILMIPSLTKEQQSHIRSLYVSFKQQQKKVMAARQSGPALDRAGSGAASAQLKRRQNKQQRRNPSAAIGGEILAGLVDEKKDAQARTAEMNSSKGNFSAPGAAGGPGKNAKFQQNKIQAILKFNSELLAILTKEQRQELRDIGLQVGSPDYYAMRDLALKSIGQQRGDSIAP